MKRDIPVFRMKYVYQCRDCGIVVPFSCRAKGLGSPVLKCTRCGAGDGLRLIVDNTQLETTPVLLSEKFPAEGDRV